MNGDEDRDTKGRFVAGSWKGGPGRPKGSRSRLATEFVDALADDFSAHGIEAIQKLRATDNTNYLKIISNILPRETMVRAFSVNATVDLTTMEETRGFLEAYKYARDRIGAPIEHIEEGAVVTEAWRVPDDE